MTTWIWELQARRALVCGASKGLGYGCAEALVREGVNVVIVARGAEALEAAATKLRGAGAAAAGLRQAGGRRHHHARGPRRGVRACTQDFDIVVTNAGGPPPGDFRDWDREAWIKAVDANMLTPIELIKATVDGMAARGFGRIVNITSSSVKAPIDILGLSNGARSGLTGFVAGVARSGDRGQGRDDQQPAAGRFRHRPPARARWPARRRRPARTSTPSWEARKKNIPARRFGTPAEFGAICAFLCSVQAGYLTGPERAGRRRGLPGHLLMALGGVTCAATTTRQMPAHDQHECGPVVPVRRLVQERPPTSAPRTAA